MGALAASKLLQSSKSSSWRSGSPCCTRARGAASENIRQAIQKMSMYSHPATCLLEIGRSLLCLDHCGQMERETVLLRWKPNTIVEADAFLMRARVQRLVCSRPRLVATSH